ncbi:metal-dependent transcriptional regulator [Ruania suaedae]|uniref:metal-dependent transcriptional regulator n=1 Tax=Ruania suaedae TaxID=2897774 RepID=UPI001E6421F1|nr:metal-dependent transcriptional regulator [Ruania suaedae]UFU02990.1 metal-dependent transcriptional regulator [Ruania suaedae]
MSVSQLSASAQNYLKVIWALQEWTGEEASPSQIAARAGVRLSTVSDAVRKLAEQGLVEHAPYGAITLTDAGRLHALAMVRRHRLIESFLVQVLGYTWDQVHDEAETLEHAVSDFMVDRIDHHLGHPTRDPHGDPIPTPDGQIELPDAVVLSTVEPGARVRVERISDDDPALLQHFAERGLGVGSELEIRAGAPYSEALEVVLPDGAAPLTLGRSATDAVWVTAARTSAPAAPR